MKSLHGLIRQSALILVAGLLLVFSVLIYAGGDTLLRRVVDGRLLGLAEALAKIVEQHPNIIESSGEDFALAAEVSRSKKEQHEVQARVGEVGVEVRAHQQRDEPDQRQQGRKHPDHWHEPVGPPPRPRQL